MAHLHNLDKPEAYARIELSNALQWKQATCLPRPYKYPKGRPSKHIEFREGTAYFTKPTWL